MINIFLRVADSIGEMFFDNSDTKTTVRLSVFKNIVTVKLILQDDKKAKEIISAKESIPRCVKRTFDAFCAFKYINAITNNVTSQLCKPIFNIRETNSFKENERRSK